MICVPPTALILRAPVFLTAYDQPTSSLGEIFRKRKTQTNFLFLKHFSLLSWLSSPPPPPGLLPAHPIHSVALAQLGSDLLQGLITLACPLSSVLCPLSSLHCCLPVTVTVPVLSLCRRSPGTRCSSLGGPRSTEERSAGRPRVWPPKSATHCRSRAGIWRGLLEHLQIQRW